MSDSWINQIPSHERERIRKRMRSETEYEKLREKVKGPEDLEREMDKNEAMAELHFALESEPELHEALKKQLEKDIQEKGIESVLEKNDLSAEAKSAIEQKKMKITVASNPSTHHDQLVVMPEGTVQEKIPLNPKLSDQYVSQFISSIRGNT